MSWIRYLLTSKSFYLSILGLILSGAATVYLLDEWIMPAYTQYNEGVTVPDVTKMPFTEAADVLERYGLRYEILDRRAHSAYPADYIIDQSPSPRQIVKPERKVYLTVNTEATPKVVVPELVNMSLRNARIQLENYGLTLGVVSYESSRFRNTVLRQSLAPGDTVNQGAVVDLAVSDGLGDEMVTVPDITGLLLPEAQQLLRENGLRIGPIHFQPSADVVPNTVLSFRHPTRSVRAGDQIREGEELHLVVSERFNLREVEEAGAVMDDDPTPQEPDTTE